MHRTLLVVLSLLATVMAATPSIGRACVAFGAGGELVPIEGEEALVVWDEATGTEHFVRRASFANVPRDFGFLVPTPTRPTLREASDGVFHRLFGLYRAPAPVPRAGARTRSADGLETSGVTVVERVHVAGMEGTVLAASNASELDGWLASHGYRAGPDIAAWLTTYVSRGWFVTAFRIDPEGRRALRTRSICMSFTTDRPFFPYSEPAHAEARRPFRVSVVAPHRMDARLGDAPWSIAAGYAGHPAGLWRALRGALPPEVDSAGPWLTTFDDRRSLRGTEDLFFVPAESDTPVRSRIHDELMP